MFAVNRNQSMSGKSRTTELTDSLLFRDFAANPAANKQIKYPYITGS
jgi:hypothetical protein